MHDPKRRVSLAERLDPRHRATPLEGPDVRRRAELAERVEQRRRELGDRPDISQAMRKLSQSSSHNPLGGKARKRPTTLTLVLGAVAVVAMLACIGTAIGVTAGGLWLRDQLSDPTTTGDQFFSALHEQDYQQAYSYFSRAAQARLSQAAFANQYAAYDQINGIVDSYPMKSSAVNGTRATIVYIVVRRGNTSTGQLQTLTFVQENGDWRIDGITPGATVPAPATTP